MKRSVKALIGVGIGLLAAAAAWGLARAPVIQRTELTTFDLRAKSFAQPADDGKAKIRLILIDNQSLVWAQEQGLPWPWPRDVYTYILDYCGKAGVKAFVFDALFFHESAGGIVAHDQAVGESITRLPLFVTAVLPSSQSTSGQYARWPEDRPRPGFIVHGLDALPGLPDDKGGTIRFSAADVPIPEVIQATTVLGHAFGAPDADETFRRMNMLTIFDGIPIPAMGLSVLMADPVGPGKPPTLHEANVTPGRIEVRGHVVPIDDAGRATLRFRKPDADDQLYPAMSAKSIIQSALALEEGGTPVVPPEELKDAVVFFGASAAALYDLKPNPMNEKGSGLSLHATAYDNLVNDSFLAPAGPWSVAAVVLALAVLTAVLATLGRGLIEVAAVAIVTLPVPAAIGFAAYSPGVWWPIAAPTLAVTLAWVGGLAFNYATEGRQRRFLRRAFSQYVSPIIVDRIAREPGQLRLGGELRTLTIFFSDVEGFSTLSHALGPVQITTLLNTYLSDMVKILFEEHGTLDKYEGDAIIAFWNAPLDQPDHALRACRTMVRCQQRLLERDGFYRSLSGGRPLRMRIGAHTGPVVVGNMGSEERFNYTMLGDAANLASRLEGANKQVGTRLMVSEDTWTLLNGQLPGRDLGRITVVGRDTPLHVYELLTEGDSSSPRCVEFASALTEATTGRTDAAIARLDRLTDDPAAAALAAYLRSLPEEQRSTWDGVRRLTQK